MKGKPIRNNAIENRDLFSMETYRDSIEIDIGLLPVDAISGVTGLLLVESPAELEEISHDHGIHHDDEHKWHNQARYAVDNADNSHGFQILDPQIAHLVAVLVPYHPGGDEAVRVADQGEECQHQYDRFRACHGAHMRPMKRILNGDESFNGEGNDQPDAERTTNRTNIHQCFAPAVVVEDPPAYRTVKPHQEQGHEKAEIGGGQRGQVVAGATQL